MSRYAESTSVPVDRSRIEIERMLEKHGARGFFYGTEGGRAMVGFRILNEQGNILAVKLELPLPDRDADEFVLTPTGKKRDAGAARAGWEQACRSRWRALCLVLKAKLEAVAIGISTVEREFLADILLSDGTTIGQFVAENRKALEAGGRRPLLPGGKG